MASLAMAASSALAGEVVVDKGVIPPEPTKWWSADLTFGYDSLYMYRGMSVFGTSANDGLIWTNLSGTFTPVTNLSLTAGVWWGNSFTSPTISSPGSFYNELDAYATATYSAGPVDLSVGYIYYYYPYLTPDGLYDTHEVSFAAAYTALPYVTPSTTWYYDCGRYQGWFAEIRLDGEIPVYGDVVTLNPMFWTSFDFGSLRKQFAPGAALGGHASVNDIGLGLEATIQINEVISVSPYVKASFPVGVGTAINANYATHFNGSNDHVWTGANVTFSF